MDSNTSRKTIYLNTFENPGDAWNVSFLSPDTVHRGKYAFRMDGRTEYSPGICQLVSTLQVIGEKPLLRVRLYVFIPKPAPGMHTLLVISFEHGNKPYSYTSVNLNDVKLRPGKWDQVSLEAEVPAFLSPKDLVKVYIWNPGKQVFYMDDLRILMTDPE